MDIYIWLYALTGALTIAVILLWIRLNTLKRCIAELARSFGDKLGGDTNTLVDVSCRDPRILSLANAINAELRELRSMRLRFERGDTELNEAVTNISHDLRTPLTAMFGYIELMEREDGSEPVRRYLSMIKNRAEALNQLIGELFRYSLTATAAGERMEPVNINDVLSESLAAAYGALTGRGIQPQITIPEIRVERVMDRSALSRIFANIISNAVKYSDGDLTVTMDERGAVVFSNSAAGITPVIAGRLFDRFYTVDTGRSSTGLGLSIARLLTERMGGRISADHRDGRLFITVEFFEAPSSPGI